MKIPSMLLRQLYTSGSLANEGEGFRFRIKNRLTDASLTRVLGLWVDGRSVPIAQLTLELADGRRRCAVDVTPESPAPFPRSQLAVVRADHVRLVEGEHELRLAFDTQPFGTLEVNARDALDGHENSAPDPEAHIPHMPDDVANFAHATVEERRRFVEHFSGATLEHVSRFSFDSELACGHAENFTGVAQIPLGFAGPLRVNGEHAQGEFLIPLATTEGTLVASYSRGMKVLNLSGGVTTTVSDDRMQRAPVFVFDSARAARDFRTWVMEHLTEIRTVAEATSSVAKLQEIEAYLSNKFAFLRFDFSTGDAGGQNMVSRATLAASEWILRYAPGVSRFFLESNFASDKKHSRVNVLHTRGKRVTAEATVPGAVLRQVLRASAEQLHSHNEIANVGAFIAGTNNNGLHSVNGITAMFIACGQDVANVAEATAATVYTELTPSRDLYMSITIPSLIVATHGGGTHLPTQQECLAVLGCTGRGTVNKLAEIVAGVVLAGELSLAGAISSMEWVSAHERHGRHR
jgi:hydroxymethylglutaryl-CoA reductase (NADPH)